MRKIRNTGSYHSKGDLGYVFLGLLIVVLLCLSLGRWAFGWGYGFLTTQEDVEMILEERGYEVVEVKKGHFKGFFAGDKNGRGGLNNCRDDASQWYALVDNDEGETVEIEVCTEERLMGIMDPRVSIFE